MQQAPNKLACCTHTTMHGHGSPVLTSFHRHGCRAADPLSSVQADPATGTGSAAGLLMRPCTQVMGKPLHETAESVETFFSRVDRVWQELLDTCHSPLEGKSADGHNVVVVSHASVRAVVRVWPCW